MESIDTLPSSNSSHRDTLVNRDADKDTREAKNQKNSPFPGFGIFCGILSAFFYSLIALFVKQLHDLHPVQVTLSRSCGQFLLLLPFMTYKRNEVDITGSKNHHLKLWVQGFIGSGAVLFQYLAISKLPLGNAVTVAYSSLIFTPILARIVLKETLTAFDLIFAVAALTGVILIAQPSFIFPITVETPGNDIGILFSVICAVFQSSGIILLRMMTDCYPVLITLYYSISSCIVTTFLLSVLNGFSWPCWNELPYLFLMGLLGTLAQILLIFSAQHERAGTVGVLRSFQIILVFVLQVTVLKDIPTPLSLIGAALVFSSNAGIGVRKLFNERKNNA